MRSDWRAYANPRTHITKADLKRILKLRHYRPIAAALQPPELPDGAPPDGS
jgi:nitroreductase